MRPTKLEKGVAGRLFDMLIPYGALPSQYTEFMNYFTKEDDVLGCYEFRCLTGKLGFGGKLYWDGECLRADY